MHRRSALLLALVLLGGPILCGAVYFRATGPAETPGAYVELVEGLYRLPSCATATAAMPAAAAVAPGEVRSIFLVLSEDATAANAEAAKLYLRVMNHAEPQTDYGRTPVPTTVARMTPRAYRVRSDRALRWDSQGLPNTVFRQALIRMLGNRATTEVLLELEVPQPAGAPCRYALTLGPPPSLPDNDLKWFVPSAERRP